MLSQAQVDEFNERGFLSIPDFTSPPELAAMQEAAQSLLEGFDPQSISVFSTRNQTSKTDQYFLDSASSVSFFFEEGAFDADGQLVKPKALAVNKIGHAMHDLVPAFTAWTRDNPKIISLLRSLGFRRPLPVQSMFIFKQPGIGGEVVPHQDTSFLYTDPPSATGLWLALEDATIENGCLWALPGSHHGGTARRFVRAPDGSVSFVGASPEYDLAKFEPLEVKAGTLVLLHGSNLHYSQENKSDKSRHAFSVHMVEGTAQHRWLEDNWLQRRPDLPFEPLYYDESAAAPA